jgi:hypothetical protein
MTVNTGYLALTGAADVSSRDCVRVYRRTIDMSKVTGASLTSGDHLAIFAVPAGALLVSGVIQVTTVDAGGGTVCLGIAATGTTIVNAQAVSVKTAAATSDNIQLCTTAAGVIYMSAASFALTTAVVTVTLLVLEPNANPVQG